MNPSSMAWRIGYRWNGWCLPSSPNSPNNSNVRPLGVAVKAKKDRLGCRPLATTASARKVSASVALIREPVEA